MRLNRLVWLILLFVLAAPARSIAQNNSLRLPTPPVEQKPRPEDEVRQKMERDMAKKANLARQADLKRDTDKLLKLATEL